MHSRHKHALASELSRDEASAEEQLTKSGSELAQYHARVYREEAILGTELTINEMCSIRVIAEWRDECAGQRIPATNMDARLAEGEFDKCTPRSIWQTPDRK